MLGSQIITIYYNFEEGRGSSLNNTVLQFLREWDRVDIVSFNFTKSTLTQFLEQLSKHLKVGEFDPKS